MNFVIFDLEWNRYAKRVKTKCPDEVIQIGAVRYNGKLEYEGSFNCLIRPVLYNKMEPTVEEMTGLTIEKLRQDGMPFNKAFKKFRAFMGEHFVLMSWGMQDAQVLRQNCLHYNGDMSLSWLEHFADLQKYATRRLTEDGPDKLMGLKMAADLFPIEYEEESLHDALVDATLSGEVFVRIYDKKTFKPYIVDASTINHNYKNIPITDMKNQSLDKKEFRMRCPVCGRFVTRRADWKRSGNKFVARHFCKHCGKELMCSIEAMLSYGNSVRYKKKSSIVEK